MVSGIDPVLAEYRSELESVLSSREFVRSPSLAKLLRYLCEKSFSGQIQEIKEFSIATEVFGRDRDFGEKRDSFVRVEVHRLRKKLQQYYASQGSSRPLQIVIRPGNYQPCFQRTSVMPRPTLTDGLADPTELIAAPAPESRDTSNEPNIPTSTLTTDSWITGGRRRWLFAGLGFALLIVMARITVTGLISGQSREVLKVAARTAGAPPVGALPQPVRILAGSPTERSVDRFGTEWMGDRYFTGGDQNVVRFGSQERAVRHPIILGAPDQTLFRTFRAGDFSYQIPLPPGKYEMRLYFSEVVLTMGDYGEGAENQRVFDVNLNSRPLLPFFDIFSDAGGADTADIRIFENVSPEPDGFLKLAFRPVREMAWLNAIELIPNSSGKALPLRIVARNTNYTDRHGKFWGSDRCFVGSRATSDGKEPAGTEDPELFAGQRYGHFSYRLPVAPGKYTLRLLFAETFFGPTNRGKGGVGSRVFNVYCSGLGILKQFDIFKEAGENRAVEKVFHGVTPNAQGRIDLMFEPVVNYAIVQAIELTPEDGAGSAQP